MMATASYFSDDENGAHLDLTYSDNEGNGDEFQFRIYKKGERLVTDKTEVVTFNGQSTNSQEYQKAAKALGVFFKALMPDP